VYKALRCSQPVSFPERWQALTLPCLTPPNFFLLQECQAEIGRHAYRIAVLREEARPAACGCMCVCVCVCVCAFDFKLVVAMLGSITVLLSEVQLQQQDMGA
jgi:hypothetical protein